MKTFLRNFIFYTFIFLSFNQIAHAQSGDMQKQIEEIMKAREEMLRMLMDDRGFEDFEKRMEQMMKNFGQGGFGLQQFDDPIVGEYEWLKTNTHKILKLKVKQVKDRPLDIKIEGGMIRLKGDVETVNGEGQQTVRRKVSFQRAFTLPDDVDQKNPEFESVDGAMLIKFKLKKGLKQVKPSSEPSPAVPDRMPLAPDKEEIQI